MFLGNECTQVNCCPMELNSCQFKKKFLGFMCYRTLDNGEVDFCTERVKQKCSNEAGKDAMSIEDIGPQEEGELSLP